ncbi:Hsp20/alpha crystallin family protein [Sphingomonas alba]|uniref:Hsp20/alpha crystallin family protein n=1 Tax=Sphingomonas alba TaxID=2908208 RepID=A0ABT0RP94_9SPHN|nr:Hsp20/alpha crystallin family protein [Sphingomonas alba]MCL6684474.1 Hsp20/alpha crystallin family protein [Sphingomonas alba]
MNVTTDQAQKSSLSKRPVGDFTDQLIDPFNQLRSEVDHIFESFPFRMPSLHLPRMTLAVPPIEMTETGKAFKITAELPGIDPENVEVTFEGNILRIAGEKQSERDENERGYRLSERSYGAFERMIELPATADGQKIEARFKNGVLKVTIAKNGDPKAARRIKVHKDS